MILYHFTAAKLIEAIKREGITLGGYMDLVNGGLALRRGFLWMTTNPDFYGQEWNGMVTIKYDRTEFRITVEIPEPERHRVINWLEFCNSGGVHPQVAEILNGYGDPQNWRLFKGTIPPAWFTSIDRKLLAIPHKRLIVSAY